MLNPSDAWRVLYVTPLAIAAFFLTASLHGAEDEQFLLADGTMEQTETLEGSLVAPKGWTKTHPKGNVSVSRDTEVKHSGEASLRFEILEGNSGNIGALIGTPGGREV